jgi:hypothetical protein
VEEYYEFGLCGLWGCTMNKEILKLGGSIQDRDDLVSELLDLCNSSEQNDSTKDFRTAFPEVKAFRQEEDEKSSPPVQNPLQDLKQEQYNELFQKKCTCKVAPVEAKYKRETICVRCGGAL